MSVDAGELVGRLRATFEANASASNAVAMAAYMRDQFPFFGIATPQRRALVREVLRGLPKPTERSLAASVRAMWAEPERELQYVACDYLAAHIRSAGPDFIAVIEELITTKSWWDTVDGLAPHGAGPLVRSYPELVEVMDRWIDSSDFWLARAAIIHQLSFGQATDADRLFTYCRRRAADKEFFIRKSIGWALRQYAAVDHQSVEHFVSATPALSALSVREATKGIDRARRR